MTPVSRRQRDLLISLCLALVTIVVYSPVLRFGFISLDDEPYITENPHLRGGLTLHGLGWAFTTPLDQWMPVTWLARILEYQAFGLNAGAHHLINVLFHIANTLLLFWVFNRMSNAPWRSALVGALFALHPLHVESVAWVTGLKDVLSMCFAMLSLWTYVRYVEQSTVGGSRLKVFYGLTLLFYALALMSKPMAVTLPFVLLLLDYWPLGRTTWAEPATGRCVHVTLSQLLKEKLPFFMLAAASCVVTLWAQRRAGALEGVPLRHVAYAVLSYMGYLAKAVWPTGLSVFYPLDANPSMAAVMAAGIGLVGVTVAVIWRGRREPWLVTGWFWFLGTLVPVIGLVQVGLVQGMADRYTYVPFVGLFTMLCWSVPSSAMERRIVKGSVCVVALGALVACAALTEIQVGYWRGTETLFRHALKVTRGNWVAHNNLGSALLAMGKTPEAISQWEQALQLNPKCVETYNNLGGALLDEGKMTEAISQWEQALRLRPDYAEAHYNLGYVLSQTGKLENAIVHYERALQAKPDYPEAHYRLGNALLQTGKLRDAIAHYEQALQIKPDYAEAHCNLGVALQRAGRVLEAIKHYEQALRLKPDFAEAHNNLGIALKDLDRMPEAINQYEKALRIKPDYAEAHYNLGVALGRVGRVQEAIGHYEQALRLKPDYAEAEDDLGVVLSRTGKYGEATEHFEAALRLKPDYADAHNNLGNALFREGNAPEAMNHWEAAVRINPDLAEAHNNLAIALVRLGRLSEAVEHFEQSIRIKPNDAATHYNLGGALEREGRVPEAIEQYRQVLRINPNMTEAQNRLARLQGVP